MYSTVQLYTVQYSTVMNCTVHLCTVQYNYVLYSTITYLVPVDLRDGPAPDLDLADEPPAALAVHVVQPLPEHGRELETTSIKKDRHSGHFGRGNFDTFLLGKYFTNTYYKLLKKHY